MKKILLTIATISLGCSAFAQNNGTDGDAGGNGTLTLGTTGGFRINAAKKDNKMVDWRFGRFDLGLNFMNDQTDYSATETKAFLNVPEAYQNESLFATNQGKSWNFNFWPVTTDIYLMKNKQQKIAFSTGVGLQVFNFKYKKPVTFVNDTHPEVILRQDVDLDKNKLAVTYLSIPVMINFDTKINKKLWLNYGFGMIGGFNANTLMKQKSGEHGKEKNHDRFNTNRFQATIVGEIGLNNIVTLFATYQLTEMFEYGIQQRPVSIGLRF